MPSEPDHGLVVRPARSEESDAVAALFTTTRLAAVPSMPPPRHADDEVRGWVRGLFDTPAELWVAEAGSDLVGTLILEGDWLHSLYVHPDHQRNGIGSVLVDLAKTLRPGGLGLWVFESNHGARRLYERHGFVAVEHTDGSGNEERSPDVRMVWPDPLPALRARVDGVDERLAVLLAERAELTAQIQRYKAVPGPAGRDEEREAQIARRMAERAPALGEDRLRRIMDAVITESLAAAAHNDRDPAD